MRVTSKGPRQKIFSPKLTLSALVTVLGQSSWHVWKGLSKRNGVLTQATTWVSLENVTPSEWSQALMLCVSIWHDVHNRQGFPDGASGKEAACQCCRCKRRGFDPWIGKIHRRRTSRPLQYSCLESPTDRGAWWAMVHTCHKEPDTTEAT